MVNVYHSKLSSRVSFLRNITWPSKDATHFHFFYILEKQKEFIMFLLLFAREQVKIIFISFVSDRKYRKIIIINQHLQLIQVVVVLVGLENGWENI